MHAPGKINKRYEETLNSNKMHYSTNLLSLLEVFILEVKLLVAYKLP